MPVASPTAAVRPPPEPERERESALPLESLPDVVASSTTRVIPARRARAASRPSRSANLVSRLRRSRPRSPARAGAAVVDGTGSREGRSSTNRSTARPASSEPAIARPSSASAGVRTTSHSGLIPRATASTGSSAAARSSQATIEPAACASAASRRASVVRPLEGPPRMARPIPRGTPPGPRMASSSRNPVEKTRSGSGRAPGWSSGASSGTVARAPTVPIEPSEPPRPRSTAWPRTPGAAAPQRDRRVVRAAVRSADGAGIAGSVSNRCSNESRGLGPLQAFEPATYSARE
jgi:hypothetical protein